MNWMVENSLGYMPGSEIVTTMSGGMSDHFRSLNPDFSQPFSNPVPTTLTSALPQKG